MARYSCSPLQPGEWSPAAAHYRHLPDVNGTLSLLQSDLLLRRMTGISSLDLLWFT
jgi:hypothetical protein